MWERHRSGRGQVLDVAALDCLVGVQGSFALRHPFTGSILRREPKAGTPLSGILPCADGYVVPVPPLGAADGWVRMMSLLEEPALLDDRFATEEDRDRERRTVNALIEARLRAKPKGHWFHEAQRLRMPFAPVQNAADIAGCPQLAARGFYEEVQGLDGRAERLLGRPFLMAETPWRLRRPAPRLGDTALDAVDWPPRPIPSRTSTVDDLPLHGIRVLELATAWAGPAATKALADFGADVIKVESHLHPDRGRGSAYADHALGDRFYDRFPAMHFDNAGKLHVCLELTDPDARALVLRLAAEADVVLENFMPHVLERLGLAYPILREQRAALIMVSSSGFGATGPWRDYGSYGMGLEAACGLAETTGYADGPPHRSAIPYPDMAAALHSAVAILLALEYRRRTGRGQWIDLAQYEVACLAAAVRRYDQVSRDPQLWHRGFWQRATSRELGPRLYLGPWARLHRTPGRIRSAAPGFAEHNRFVLCGLLGLSEAQYQGLLARGATSEELSGFARPASAGLTAEEELALGDTRGFDPDYQALNRAGPAAPHVSEPPVQWLAAPISSRTGR